MLLRILDNSDRGTSCNPSTDPGTCPTRPSDVVSRERHGKQPNCWHQGTHRVARNRARHKIHNYKRNERPPSQRPRKLSIFLRGQVFEPHQRQKQYPRQKIKHAVWNIENPPAKLEVGATEPAGELLQPFRCRCCVSGRLQKWNRPGRKNSEHDKNASEMRRMKQRSPTSLF